MRSLLDVREQYLNEFSFPDPYAEVSYNVCNPSQSVSSSQSDSYALFAFVDLFSLCFFLLFGTVIKFVTRLVCVKSNCPCSEKHGKETRQ